ncbi:MAG: nucleotidyl transferase AbiEii/AbiGii toxin family protein, partial [Desulfobacteraceae bacterium]|nr:nucleotidyl transferase AbiEii/AbiGii toxin family protein [Desulfobacteraceae bacterium]
MYTEAISDPLWGLLKRLSAFPEMKFAYLGGGTALSLQLGHRKSEDLDFFLIDEFDELAFMRSIQRSGLDTLVTNQTSNHTQLMIQSSKVDLIQSRMPLKFTLKAIHPETANLKMADAKD